MNALKWRNLSYDFGVSIAFNCVLVFRIFWTDQNNPLDANAGTFKTLERQKRVINRAERTARRQNYRQREMPHQVDHELVGINRYHDPARSFYNEGTTILDARKNDFIKRYFAAGTLSGQVRRYWILENITFRNYLPGVKASQGDYRFPVCNFACTSLNRFPVNAL